MSIPKLNGSSDMLEQSERNPQTHVALSTQMINGTALKTAQEIGRKDPHSLYEHCKNCPKETHCCYRAPTIVVLPTELDRLVHRTNRPDLFLDEGNGLFTIKKAPGQPCPFLTKGQLCGVYDIRPTDCRSWPLTLDKTGNPGGRLLEDSECSAVRAGALSLRFEQAARAVLVALPEQIRPEYVRLVHRDFEDGKIKVSNHNPQAL